MLASEEKDFIRVRIARLLKVDIDDLMVFPGEMEEDGSQVDIVWAKPTKDFNYHVLVTAGLSEMVMEEPEQCMELIMMLPADWKMGDTKDQWWWPIELLSRVAYTSLIMKDSLTIGSVVSLTKDDAPFMKGTKNCGLVVTVPEHFDLSLCEIPVADGLFLRFHQVIPVNKEDIERINEEGVYKYIKYTLHNADGPDFVVKKD